MINGVIISGVSVTLFPVLIVQLCWFLALVFSLWLLMFLAALVSLLQLMYVS